MTCMIAFFRTNQMVMRPWFTVAMFPYPIFTKAPRQIGFVRLNADDVSTAFPAIGIGKWTRN